MTNFDKKVAIIENIVHAASKNIELLKELPKTGKMRNIFIKSYNRRPQSKKKRGLVLMKIATNSYFSAIRQAVIISQPIPKYKKGGL